MIARGQEKADPTASSIVNATRVENPALFSKSVRLARRDAMMRKGQRTPYVPFSITLADLLNKVAVSTILVSVANADALASLDSQITRNLVLLFCFPVRPVREVFQRIKRNALIVGIGNAIHFELALIFARSNSADSFGNLLAMPFNVLGFLPAPGLLPPLPII